jgi:predicted dehydrogenase
VTVHQNRRWDAEYQLVRRVLAEDTLGEVYRVESRYTHFSRGWGTWGAQGQTNPWRLKRDYGGGLLNDWGPHLFDQLILLHPASVGTLFGRCESRIWSREVEDHFWAELFFADGLSARVEAANTFRVPVPRWTVVGTRGTLQISGGDSDQWNQAVLRRAAGASTEELHYDIDQQKLSSGFYAAFVHALAGNQALPVSPEQALRVMRLLEAVRESSRLGRSVVVEESAGAQS